MQHLPFYKVCSCLCVNVFSLEGAHDGEDDDDDCVICHYTIFVNKVTYHTVTHVT